MASKRFIKCTICGEAKSKLTKIEGDLYCAQCMEEMMEEDINTEPQPANAEIDITEENVMDLLAGSSGQSNTHDGYIVVVKKEADELDDDDDHAMQASPSDLSNDIVLIKGTDDEDLIHSAVDIKDVILEEDTRTHDIAGKNTEQEEKRLKLTCNYCGILCRTQAERKIHLKEAHAENRKATCSICYYSCRGDTLLRKHIQEQHDGFESICRICLELYHSGEYSKHKPKCKGRLVFLCKFCKEYYSKRESLLEHLDAHNVSTNNKEASFYQLRIQEQFFSCKICENDVLYKQTFYWKHVQLAHQGHHIVCKSCPKTFKSTGARSGHICPPGNVVPTPELRQNFIETCSRDTSRRLPPGTEFLCPECPKVYRKKFRLNEHIQVTHRIKPELCNICGAECRTKGALKYHKLTAHTNPKFVCPYCDKRFYYVTTYHKHVMSHEKPYNISADEIQSQVLTKPNESQPVDASSESSTLPRKEDMQTDPSQKEESKQVHLRQIHPEDKRIICTICYFVGRGETLYRKHIQQEHNGFECMCKICHEFYHLGGNETHNNECQGRLVLQCNSCEEMYGKKEALWKHLDTHDISADNKASSFIASRIKERFYSCKICVDDRLFRHGSYWQHVKYKHHGHHMRCKNCPKTFRSRAAKSNHVCDAAKFITKLFKCPECSKVYNNGFKLNEHLRTIHHQKPVKCKICGVKCKTEKQYKYHKLKVHTPTKYECPVCQKPFHFYSYYRAHILTHQEVKTTLENDPKDDTQPTNEATESVEHEDASVQNEEEIFYLDDIDSAPSDDQSVKSAEIEREVGNSCTGNSSQNTNDVTIILSDEDDNQEVISTEAPINDVEDSEIPSENSKMKCSYCGFRCETKPEYRKHVQKNHPEERTVSCSICYFVGKGETTYKKHIQEKHNGFECMCRICLELYHRGGYSNHKIYCLGRQVYQCQLCDIFYGKKQNLWQHLEEEHDVPEDSKDSSITELRINEQFYSCAICEDERVYEKDDYWEHVRSAHQGHHLRCRFCGKTFKALGARSRHTSVECKSNPTSKASRMVVQTHKCSECSKVYTTRFRLREHLGVVHNTWQQVKCDFCEAVFKTKSLLKSHQLKVHTKKMYPCGLCQQNFSSSRNFRLHLLQHRLSNKTNQPKPSTSVEAMICSDAELEDDSSRQADFTDDSSSRVEDTTMNAEETDDEQSHQPEQAYVKEIDGFIIESIDESDTDQDLAPAEAVLIKDEITIEEAKVNINAVPELKLSCQLCGLEFTTDPEFHKHLKQSHPEDKMLDCSICFFVCKGDTLLRRHFQEKHGGYDCVCKICLELYRSSDHKSHQNQCLGRQLLRCELCKECYLNKESLWKHLNKHELAADVKELYCTVCRVKQEFHNCVICKDDKAYAKDLYWQHIKVAHQGHHILCKNCSKTFKTRAELISHEDANCKIDLSVTRVDKQKYKCPDCNKIYKNKDLLRDHRRNMHKSATCEFCGVEFKSLSQYKYHKNTIHCPAKFQCPYCLKKFHYSTACKTHMTVHKKEKEIREMIQLEVDE